MTDPNGTQATAEYYILRVYRRRQGTHGGPHSLVGVVEDTQGHRQHFHDREELWRLLAEKLGPDHPAQ